ncbi:WhiB family transcriptional regulator [Streptomyces sp. NPDC091281]|uniref:WhiB family transcriptional regulator n=1 Tax=Streptomyces sp. NPDC091281 TaxID=3365985 RepID=UPI00381036ED
MAYTGSVPDTAGRHLDWMAYAGCGTEEARAVFDDPAREHEARVICVARCLVRTQCLRYVQQTERGLHSDQRDGVAAGLSHSERHRLDPAATFREDDPKPLRFDGSERCGTHPALIRHLWNDEPIDAKCWSGEVRREKENTVRAAGITQPLAPVRLTSPQQKPPPKGESPHERRVYRLWEQGLTDLQIARRMAISQPQIRRVRDRLGLAAHPRPAPR